MRAFRVAYDGRPFRGFQRQPDVPTVEDALLDALRALDVLADDAGAPPEYAAAGRTDAGVSALAQTVALDAPEWLTPAAWNAELPADVRAWASAAVPAGFHATHDALAREYVYHLHAPAAHDALARDVLDALAGEHDFHNLTPDADGTVRSLETDCRRDGDFLLVRFRAGGFPRHFVRRAVGLVREVLEGTAPPSKVERVLAAEPLSGPAGVPTAPARPLVLADVTYEVDGATLEFSVDDEAAASAEAVFADRRVEHATNARVAGSIADGIE